MQRLELIAKIVELYPWTEKKGLFRSTLEESESRTTGDFHPRKRGKIHVDDRGEQRAKKGEAQVSYSREKMVLVHPGVVEEVKEWEVCGSDPKLILKIGADEKEEPRERDVQARLQFPCSLKGDLHQTDPTWNRMTDPWND